MVNYECCIFQTEQTTAMTSIIYLINTCCISLMLLMHCWCPCTGHNLFICGSQDWLTSVLTTGKLGSYWLWLFVLVEVGGLVVNLYHGELSGISLSCSISKCSTSCTSNEPSDLWYSSSTEFHFGVTLSPIDIYGAISPHFTLTLGHQLLGMSWFKNLHRRATVKMS